MNTIDLELTPEVLNKVQEQVMTAGGVLQSLRPGALDAIATATEGTLNGKGNLILSTIERRRREAFVKVLRAAETLRDECAKAMLVFSIIDPTETN